MISLAHLQHTHLQRTLGAEYLVVTGENNQENNEDSIRFCLQQCNLLKDFNEVSYNDETILKYNQ